MSEQKIAVAIIVVASIAFVSVGWVAGEDMTRKTWQEGCVKRDFAEYNQKTGEWQWKSDSNKCEKLK